MRCAACGAALPPAARFCPACGAPAEAGRGGGSAEPAGRADLAERRRVSIVFLDLEAFTTLTEALDPEEVRALQSRYFEMARTVVATYGGTIEKFIGDAVMAVWGAPLAHEDDADRAVRAALALVNGVGRLGGAASRGRLAARAAVATGEVAMTVGAVGQGLVAGDLVNTAARLQAAAPSDGVLVDAPTREAADAAARYEPVGDVELRGRSAAVPAYRAAPRDAAPARASSHTGPFVGRDRELRELVELFDGVVRDRRCRLVTVTGIAGIGKSRLVWELLQRLDERPEHVAWHAGRAPAYGEEVTFTAVAEMVRRRIRVAERIDPELATRHLATVLAELVRDDEERRWLEPRVAVLLGRDGRAGFDRAELFAAWRRFFERVSDSAPAVLVFEDLQWADAGLLDFVEHIASWARDHPILILAVARPELLDRRAGWGSATPSHTAIALERLSDDAMRTLLLGREPGMDDALVARVLRQAGGVPLYAVEVTRMLVTAADHGVHQQAGVPASLHNLVAARIDALPAAERRLLLAAAVVGRRFRPDALAAVAGGGPHEIGDLVSSLVGRELMTLDEEFASPGRGELAFVQELVREVAYGTVARSERRALHLAAAAYAGSLPPPGDSESLAGHLLAAYRLAPDAADAAATAERTVLALRAAARDALALHVPGRAVEHLEAALALVDEPASRSGLLDEAAAAARAAARLDLAERHLRELVERRSSLDDRSGAALARARLASVLLMAQLNEPAIAELEAALGAAPDVERDPAGAELAAQLARARVLVGEDRAALEWAERALAIAERQGLDDVAEDARITRGTARFRLGDEAAGLADLREAIARAEALGSLGTELRARNNLAWLSVEDDPRRTLDTARVGLELATSMGVGDMAVVLASVAAAAAIEAGEWDWALARFQELERAGIPEAHRIDLTAIAAVIGIMREDPGVGAALGGLEPLLETADPQVRAGVALARAWAALVDGALGRAHELAAGAAAELLGADRVQAWTVAGRAALWAGGRDAAAAAAGELAAVGAEGRATRAARQTLEAGIAALDGHADAPRRYDAATAAWRELALPLHVGLAGVDRARLLREPLAEEAEQALRGLGAKALLRCASVAAERTA